MNENWFMFKYEANEDAILNHKRRQKEEWIFHMTYSRVKEKVHPNI